MATISRLNKRSNWRKRLLRAAYLRADETEVNVALSLVPRPLVTEIIATAMPAAMRPYSIAVAADSSFRKVLNFHAMLGNVVACPKAFIKLQARN
jgi:hypothetical protein